MTWNSSRPVPLLPELPLIGSLPQFKLNRLFFLSRVARAHRDICAFHLGPQLAILVNRAEYVNQILVSSAVKTNRHSGKSSLRKLMGEGLPYREGDSHKQHRRQMAPRFQHSVVFAYGGDVATTTEEHLATWEDGALIELYEGMTDLTLKLLCSTLFRGVLYDDMQNLWRALFFCFQYLFDESTSLIRLPASLPTPGRVRFQRLMSVVDRLIEKIVDDTQKNPSKYGDNFVSLLLSMQDGSGNPLTPAQVRDNIRAFLMASVDTSSILLSWALYNLMQHPNIYARLQQSVDSVLSGRMPSADDLPALSFNTQIIKETLRLQPPGAVLNRWTSEDITVDGYHIPSRTLLIWSPYLIHRRADYFPNPNQFNPDRFTLEMEKALPRSAYIPFGDGPRVCVGNHFAMLSNQIALATLVQRVTFELVPGQQIEPDTNAISLRPRHGIRVRVRRRGAQR